MHDIFIFVGYIRIVNGLILAGVAELADAHDSKSCSFWSVGSTPTTGIKMKKDGISENEIPSFFYGFKRTLIAPSVLVSNTS